MVREDLISDLSTLIFGLVPGHQAEEELTLEDLEVMRMRVHAAFVQAERQITIDAQLTAEDVADDIGQQHADER